MLSYFFVYAVVVVAASAVVVVGNDSAYCIATKKKYMSCKKIGGELGERTSKMKKKNYTCSSSVLSSLQQCQCLGLSLCASGYFSRTCAEKKKNVGNVKDAFCFVPFTLIIFNFFFLFALLLSHSFLKTER